MHSNSHLALEHIRDRPSQSMSQDAQGCTFGMGFLQPRQKLVLWLMVA